jgi:hypothetical protein
MCGSRTKNVAEVAMPHGGLKAQTRWCPTCGTLCIRELRGEEEANTLLVPASTFSVEGDLH